jgi:nitroimidazol reductase NimA-like FMN-containing flavoprotein (pyridoxamine 5'-phosphate oxidase superfamily)
MEELLREEIDALLDAQTVGRLGCHDGGLTYVIPLIYAREGDALYVLTTEGRKTRAARKSPAVCFEVDEYDAASGSWRSAIVQGRYEELDDDGKAHAIALLSKRHGGRRGDAQPPPPRPTVAAVAFRVVIESVTGRAVRRGG